MLGHSDGASGALVAASADWDVRATVAVSASVAPSQFVNHVAPQNLVLVYGADDRFVLNDTDSALIARGTRGYLAGPGQFGNFAAVHILLLHHYEVAIDATRFALLLVLIIPAASMFGVLEASLRWAADAHRLGATACLVLLAALTAGASSRLFERMSIAPGYLLAAVLIVFAAQRLGDRSGSGVTAAVAGACTISWLGAVVCALY